MAADSPTTNTEPPAGEALSLACPAARGEGKSGAEHRPSELALVVVFLLIIAAVPIGQTLLELVRHQRVQATDVFRYRPTARNLRQFEATLKEKSWFQQLLRPRVQQALFATLREPGAKAIEGRDQWLFYKPDVTCLVEPDRHDGLMNDAKWVSPNEGETHRQGVVRAVTRFRDQLRERGIGLLVVPVPGKPSVYPDQVTSRLKGETAAFRSPTLDLLDDLQSKGVAVVNLFAEFGVARRSANGAADAPLYLARDTHWTPRGAGLAADAVARELRALKLAPAPSRKFTRQKIAVDRWGDVLEMMQIPGLRQVFAVEPVDCEQVRDPALGLMVPGSSDRPGAYRFPGQTASVLVLGDSFCRIYQFPEPQTLGALKAADAPTESGTQAAKRLLPGSAGFVSQLALALESPVDCLYSDGGAATDVRRALSTNPEILDGKKVVVWEFVERDIALGAAGWQDVALPAKIE